MHQFNSETERRAAIRLAWVRWTLLTVPLSVAIMIAVLYLGFLVMLPVLLLFLAGVLLFQRYVRKRSWHSIMWGVYAERG